MAPRIPLRCNFCGETWEGTAASIGRLCALNPAPAGAPGDIYQCDPDELDNEINWDLEVF